MGFGICRGSFLVTHIKSMGGTQEYDLVMVIGGFGTVSEPWKVKSTITCKTYTVAAMDITSESYHQNQHDDAVIIYASLTHRQPEEQKPPSVLDSNPF